ncbi:MAG: hypothetical protein SPK72_02120 [Bacteroidales bacterium]|jgi:hypothetical protein|nr:hypothetical protein [Bacteroidales bacterium]
MSNKQDKEPKQSIFVQRKHVTLGMKLVCTFAITYYILYFVFMTYVIFTYNTVFDKAYFKGELNALVVEHHYDLFLVQWVSLGVIVTSLFLIFFKQRWGKFLFMIFTLVLIGIQIQTTNPPAWLSYILELSMVLIIAPLRVVAKIKDRIQIETQKINPFKEEK